MLTKAFKNDYSFINPNKYRLFLKSNLLRLNPNYYSVTQAKSIQTTTGPMYAVRIVLEITNPDLEPIAECWINNEHIYLWRDQCWAIAVDKDKKLICIYDDMVIVAAAGPINVIPPPCNKTMVIHPIGEMPIKESIDE